MITPLLLIIIILWIVWSVLKRPLYYWSGMGIEQNPNPAIIFGDMLQLILRQISYCEFIENIYNMHPKQRYFGIYQFYKPTLVLRDPNLIKQVTISDFDHFTDKRDFVDPDAEPLWGRNVFSLKGQEWREMRYTLSGSFTNKKLKTMFNLMSDTAQNFVQYLQNTNKDVIEIELKEAYTRYTNDVITTTAFGIKVDSMGEPNNIFYTMGQKCINFAKLSSVLRFLGFILMPKIFKMLKIGLVENDVREYFTNIIYDTIRAREEHDIVRPDIINYLLEIRKKKNSKKSHIEACDDQELNVLKEEVRKLKKLTNSEICAQAFFFFLAGFDTSATALSFGSYELAFNKHIQDTLRKQIKETYEAHNGNVTYDALMKMKYLDMVVTEILRKWPPAVVFDRVCTRSYTIEPVSAKEKPIHIKVGDIIWIPVQGIHRDPNYYSDPEKFNPDRFSNINKDNLTPHTFLPFGIGPRNCIGSRFALVVIKSLIFHLLLNYEVVPIQRTPVPLKLDKKFILKHTAEAGFWLGLKKIC